MEKIIKLVLKENDLYTPYNNSTIGINKPDEFFKIYHGPQLNVNHFDFNVPRDKNGYILLDEIPYIKSNVTCDGHTSGFWIVLSNGSKVLLKKEGIDNGLREIIFNELCNSINFPCADYEIVRLKNETFTATPSFFIGKDRLVDYLELRKIYKKINPATYPSIFYNIEIDMLLDKVRNIKLDKYLAKVILLDLLFDNYDRMPYNLDFIKSNGKIKAAPLYDNGGCCGATRKSLEFRPSVKDSNDKEVLFHHLCKDPELKEWLISVYQSLGIEQAIENVLENKKIYTDDTTYKKFADTLDDSFSILKKQLS